MPAFTTHLNLYKPGGGSSGLITPDEVVDVDRLNQNMDDIDTWAEGVDDELELQPHTLVLRRAMSASNGFTNQSSFADFPVSADATALAASFIKRSASTKLVVRMTGSPNFTSGASQAMFLGINIDGTDTEVARMKFPTATVREVITGEVEISGVGAGTLDIKARFRATTASSVTFETGDVVSLSITETS